MVEVQCQPSLSALSNRSYSHSRLDQGSIVGSPMKYLPPSKLHPLNLDLIQYDLQPSIMFNTGNSNNNNHAYSACGDTNTASQQQHKLKSSKVQNIQYNSGGGSGNGSQGAQYYQTYINHGNVMTVKVKRTSDDQLQTYEHNTNSTSNNEQQAQLNYKSKQGYISNFKANQLKHKNQSSTVNNQILHKHLSQQQFENHHHDQQQLEHTNGSMTQRNIKMPKIMIDRDRILTHRKVQNRQSSLQEIELKYIDILMPKQSSQNIYNQRKIKLNVDSMNDIESKFCLQSLRNLRADLNESFKSNEDKVKIPKVNELKKIKDLINTERHKGGTKNIVWDQKSITKHLRYPDNIIHKKQSLPSILMPQRQIPNYQQTSDKTNSKLSKDVLNDYSHSPIKPSQFNVIAKQISNPIIALQSSKNLPNQNLFIDMNNTAASSRVRFISDNYSTQNQHPLSNNPIIHQQDQTQTDQHQTNILTIDILMKKQQQQLLNSNLKLSETDHDKIDENMQKGEYLPDKGYYFLNTKKASVATQNQIKLYLEQKRKESSYFQKPNLFAEWQSKQPDKWQNTESKIDNRRNSNQSQNEQ